MGKMYTEERVRAIPLDHEGVFEADNASVARFHSSSVNNTSDHPTVMAMSALIPRSIDNDP